MERANSEANATERIAPVEHVLKIWPLLKSFQNKIEELGIPSGSTFWTDVGCGSVQIKDADTLFAIVNHCPRVKIVVRTEYDHSSLSSDSVEEEHGSLLRKHKKKNRSRTRSHSRGRSRSHSRDRHRKRHHCILRSLCHSDPRDLPPHRCRRQTHSPGFNNKNTPDLDCSNDQPPNFSFPTSTFCPCYSHRHFLLCGLERCRGDHKHRAISRQFPHLSLDYPCHRLLC
ncbi:hypothetical protein KIN20_014007 [Parelaphostrongylus tenuis]|uniref:Uncharacterized protein n=1 Tax=Parelaphostrongylus tenuis TaxID=148309 RepID=A0AAD5MHN7_PARTN|nr:hypothetical protein KIN20_014007 [Parelaphostrongylus tenuis]